jgi:hypothetical protein
MMLALILDVIDDGAAPLNLNTDSITESSVDVVSIPAKAVQSFTTNPAPTTSLPLFTVPALNIMLKIAILLTVYLLHTTSGTCKRDDNSSRSTTLVFGWTNPPWLLNTQ